MTSKSIVSPEDHSVTFVELFFDLVFVFSVTQVVSLLHDGLTLGRVGQAVLVFWLVWWAWQQFTWALNTADTTHPLAALATLIATAVAFVMAVAVPDSYGDRSVWFAAAYVLVRVIGIAIVVWTASADPLQGIGILNFSLVSIAGLVTVLVGGVVGGSLQIVLWGVTIVLDVVASAIAGYFEGWNIHPEHFMERHGLFVIIALGETVIVAAAGVTGAVWTVDLLAAGGMAVALTCALWWSYFVRGKPVLDEALEASYDVDRLRMARDVGSLLHFLILCGVIAYAVAVEEVVAHPDEPLELAGRLALASGLALFLGGMVAAVWRATRRLLVPRLLLMVGTVVAVLAVTHVAPWVSLGIGFAATVVVVALEERGMELVAKAHGAD